MDKKKQSPRVKHVPQRTCIACRETAGKRGLLRVVRTEQGVIIDPTGKQAGRGAYIHPTHSCIVTVLQSNRLNQALRTNVTAEDRKQLETFLATLPEVDDSGDSKE
jgi:predicted RNA-binding protein YlxR (DUF448 family)